MPAVTKTSASSPTAAEASRRRRLPPAWLWGVCLVLCLSAALFHYGNLLGESGFSNVAGLGLAAVGFLMMLLWGLIFSPFPVGAKILIGILCLLGLTGAASQFELVGFSGAMIPTFQRRGTARADSRLNDESPTPAPTTDPRMLVTTTQTGNFPQFLGPERNATLVGVGLSTDWTEPPQALWRQPIGAGWSGFAAVNDYAVTLEQRGSQEVVSCYLALTGELIWSSGIDAEHDTWLGGRGPRSTPTIFNGFVYALGATGVLRCLDGATGRTVWMKDLLTEYGITPEEESRNVTWGRSASPLACNGLIVVPVGGPDGGRHVSLAAFRWQTGELVWEAGDQQVSYASPSLAEFADTPQILIVNESSVSGHDMHTGQTLWQHPWPGKSNANASVSQAVAVSHDRVFLSKGYLGGSKLLRLALSPSGAWNVTELWQRNGMRTKLTNVVVRDGFVYGLDDGILSCIELDTGQRRWKRGRYGHGQLLLVDENLLVTAEDGSVLLIEASPEKLHVLGTFSALEGKTWNNPCLLGKLLLVRNGHEAACYKLP